MNVEVGRTVRYAKNFLESTLFEPYDVFFPFELKLHIILVTNSCG